MGGVMGVRFLKSHPPAVGNPDPRTFTVIKSEPVGEWWVSLIRYKGCSNFEGRKVLVTTFPPEAARELDPHFRESGGIVARFPPTEEGWRHARLFADVMRQISR